jgi:hypothetical protein
VSYALQQQNWNPEAARQWLLNHLGDQTPGLELFQAMCQSAAKIEWRESVRQVGIENLPDQEPQAYVLIGPLAAHLADADKIDVIREEKHRHQIRNPKPFLGMKEKKD